MAVGIFKKMKDAFSKIGKGIFKTTKKVLSNLPKAIDVGKKVVNAIKPVGQFIPGISNVINTVDAGLNYADKFKGIGKSLLNEVK